MNTFRIYEDLRSSLGDEAAKSLAHTLGPMFEELGNTVTKAEFRELTATIGRLADAQERTEEKISLLTDGQASLAAAQGGTEAQVAKLAAAQAGTEAQVAKLTEAQARTESQVAKLAAAQAGTEAQVAKLTEAQARTEAQVAKLTEAQARTEAQVARLTEALARTEAQVAKLTEAQARTEAQVARLTEAQARTEAQVAKLTEAQAHTEAKLAELAAAQAKTEAEVAALTATVRSLVVQVDRQATRLDSVLGWTFEMQFRDRLGSYLGRLMRRARLLRNDEVRDAIEQAVEPDEADEVLRVDAIAAGMIDGVASHVVVEVSATCGADDIDRAEKRAGILRKAGLAAVPLVACQSISPELRSYACSRQVRVWCNGTILDTAA